MAIVPAFLMSNIYIGLCIPKALTLTRLRSYERFEILLIFRIKECMAFEGIINFRQLRDTFPYRFARGIPPKERVPYHLQSKVRTRAPHHH